jgi:hypothetical protein
MFDEERGRFLFDSLFVFLRRKCKGKMGRYMASQPR